MANRRTRATADLESQRESLSEVADSQTLRQPGDTPDLSPEVQEIIRRSIERGIQEGLQQQLQQPT